MIESETHDMFYGWGSSSERWGLGDGNTLVFAYRYVSLMFIFRLAYKKQWFVVGDQRSADLELSRSELEQRYGQDLPGPGIWSQYGLLIAIGAFVAFAVVSSAL